MKGNNKNKNTTQKKLKVLEGGGGSGQGMPLGSGKKPIYYILIFVTLFLLAQVLVGWVWRQFSQREIDVVWVEQSSIVNSFSVEGLVTFEEEVIFSPGPGYVYYQVDKGERVPVGKKLAVISGLPMEGGNSEESEENIEDTGYIEEHLQRFKQWFVYGEEEGVEDLEKEGGDILYPAPEVNIDAPKAGMVDFVIDGWEEYGPEDDFIYLDKSEFEKKDSVEEKEIKSGERVSSNEPVLKIMNNYQWYFSALVSPDHGGLLSEKNSTKMYFPFAPEKPLTGEIVEYDQQENGDYRITWRINREVDDYYNYRWCSAEVVYETKKGVKIPKEAYVEREHEKGVYIIERGTVQFQEITVLGEKEDFLLVEEMERTAAVITTPRKVKEGQRINW